MRGRISCSGRARSVLDHIARYEDSPRPLRTVNLPVGVYEWARIELPHPLDEGEWEQLMALLEAFKVGLVKRRA